jgi:prepilin peptidase CpaA
VNLAAEAPLWLALVFALLLLIAAAEDAMRLRISNVTVLLVIFAASAAAVIAGVQLGLWQNLVVFVVLLVAGTPLFAAGKLGGGDVKLLAAVGLWFSIKSAATMLIAVLLAGGVLALVVLVLRAIRWSDAARERAVILRPKGGIPYGVAIAAGALIAMALQR